MRATLVVTVVLLVFIGMTAAVGRAIFPGDFAHRLEPLRARLGNSSPHALKDLSEIDSKFGDQPLTTWMHVVPGGLFVLLAPIQFIPFIRNRYRRAHRWLGRVLLIAVVISAIVGLFFGIVRPFGGRNEAIAIVTVGAFLLVSAFRAYVAIRRGEVALHREWMIRTFAAALAISTVRIVAAALDATRALGGDPRAQLVLSMWSGWLITLAIAEIWIRYSRGRYSLDSSSSPSPRLPLRIPVPELPLIGRDASSS